MVKTGAIQRFVGPRTDIPAEPPSHRPWPQIKNIFSSLKDIKAHLKTSETDYFSKIFINSIKQYFETDGPVICANLIQKSLKYQHNELMSKVQKLNYNIE